NIKTAPAPIQQFLKTSLGAPAQPYALPAGSDAAPEPLRSPSPANNPPPPYRGGPTSAQPPLPPTLFADSSPRLVGQVLLSHAEAALSHMKLLQIASLPDTPSSTRSDNQGPRWMFEIPFATPQGCAIGPVSGQRVMSERPKVLAVALRYDKSQDSAPRVVATGRGWLGQKIIDVAREHGVPLEQNPALAEALATLELDEEIPEQLY